MRAALDALKEVPLEPHLANVSEHDVEEEDDLSKSPSHGL